MWFYVKNDKLRLYFYFVKCINAAAFIVTNIHHGCQPPPSFGISVTSGLKRYRKQAKTEADQHHMDQIRPLTFIQLVTAVSHSPNRSQNFLKRTLILERSVAKTATFSLRLSSHFGGLQISLTCAASH